MRIAFRWLAAWWCLCVMRIAECEWCGNEDCYDILKVTQRATAAEIRSAYRKLSLQFHPDKNTADNTDERFHLIATAYAILSDERKRSRYDYAIRHPEGWIDEDGNYNDEPGSLNNNIASVCILVGCIFFAASVAWIRRQEFWRGARTKTKKSKKSGKKRMIAYGT